MTRTDLQPVAFPTERTCPFSPPPKLTELRDEHPVSRLAYPDGTDGWLVTGYAAARAVLNDPRFSSRGEHRRMAVGEGAPGPTRPGVFIFMDPPEHSRFRKLFTGEFTVRRTRNLEPKVERITADRIAAMRDIGPPVDLVREFALPIPSLVICELLGVPYEDHAFFQRHSETMLDYDRSMDEVVEAFQLMAEFLTRLVRLKRERPQDDLLSRVAASDLTDEEAAGSAMLVLTAGHETTAKMLGLGTYLLLSRPEQLALLRKDPSLIDGAVEEMLRYLSIVQFGIIRGATQDVELEGRRIRAGEVVTVALSAANRDGDAFQDPDALDLTRSAGRHLGFGYGVHQCVGQQLARVEMRVAFGQLIREFPGLHLAAAPDEIETTHLSSMYGVRRLPVGW
ncbi:cytochrome P450 [Streptomyces sp. NBC_00047]|uniref:cytochrome P450 n=1 Tax=Streptomyces sp. NBC_00047 TaxID=2975627 RepID=UPI002253F4AC|nr:cytochrome P450 [Streptomyces sp. NBC_00047]MCX5612948.1 cytochrome P450 [Streptomyces sp. NBC_00047]